MTDGRFAGLAREALITTTPAAQTAGLAREALVTTPTAGYFAGLAREVLAQFPTAPDITGALAAIEDATDSAVFAGSVVGTGTLAATESPDTAAFAGEPQPTGTLAVTEGIDTALFIGNVLSPITGTLGAREPTDVAYFFRGGPPQAALDRPPVVPLVPSDVNNARATNLRFARAINQILRGGIGATMGVTLVPNSSTSAFNDTRI